jgi:hypothetical protein
MHPGAWLLREIVATYPSSRPNSGVIDVQARIYELKPGDSQLRRVSVN